MAIATGTPASVTREQRCAISRAPAGSSRITTATPSGASRTMRLSAGNSSSDTASAASSCARNRACSATGRRTNSVILANMTLAREGRVLGSFTSQAGVEKVPEFYTLGSDGLPFLSPSPFPIHPSRVRKNPDRFSVQKSQHVFDRISVELRIHLAGAVAEVRRQYGVALAA